MTVLSLGTNLRMIAQQACMSWPSVRFYSGKFEQVTLPLEHYDLIYSAQAFHWVDQDLRWHLCRRYLTHDGSVGPIYNYSPMPDQGLGRELTLTLEKITAGCMKATDHNGAISKWKVTVQEV